MNKQRGSTMLFSRATTSVFALVCGVFGAAVAAPAATIIVTSDSGGIGGPDCTLRDAMTAANTDTATGGCPAGNGADTIELPAGATITLTEVDNAPVDIGPNGLPSVASMVTIHGNGTTIRRDPADSTPDFRIIHVAEGGDLTLSDLTVSGGKLSSGPGGSSVGGGIVNDGTLTLTHSVVSDNTALRGGGIFNSRVYGDTGPTATLTNCTVSGNTAAGPAREGPGGGGIYNHTATLMMTNCTVSDNTTTNSGGGIYNFGLNHFNGTATLLNCTISGNTATNNGGGIFNNTPGEGGPILTMTNCTISGNTANDSEPGFFGGGIFNTGTLTLTNSIVANSTGAADCAGAGVTVDDGYNIIEDGTCITDPTSFGGDPMLGPLQDNGGPTQTHALLAGSPAIDEIASENCEVDSDQRGVPRPQGDGCDIGSYELKSFCLADFDGDGTVDASDLAQLLGGWGPCADCEDCPADFDGDCIVNAADLALLLGSWGACF